MRPQTLQLNDVLSELQMLLRRLVGETIELDVVHGRDLWLVKADLNQFEQVIVNLVVNARDAINDGGKITLRTRNFPASECAELEGHGGRPGRLCAGRGRGHRARHSARGPRQDLRAVLHHQGGRQGHRPRPVDGLRHRQADRRLCVLRQRAGRGRDVSHSSAPARRGDEADEPVKKEAAKPAADLTGRGAILLVEDEEAVRAFASRALASRGYTVLEAETGVDALSVVEKAGEPIDLIVSDVIMPEMDGPTMLTELRRRGLTAKVVFVSGYADDAFARNLPEGQEFVFLPKPFTLKQLIETVKGAMN